ncbi:MAG: hypothetical protein K1X95_00120 [Acidimicrobiia bacterium]|nr:hypothetical protein [Acidimicrobiia bacterium]
MQKLESGERITVHFKDPQMGPQFIGSDRGRVTEYETDEGWLHLLFSGGSTIMIPADVILAVEVNDLSK